MLPTINSSTIAMSELTAGVKAVQLGLNDEQGQFFTKALSLNFRKLLLLGEAGSGKTFVLTSALAELHRQGVRIVLCAPTHLARIALQSKMPEDVRPYIETRTLASLLGRFGFNTGDGGVGFSAPKSDRLGGYDIIAIDECSMIGEREYDVLSSHSARIIYTGDFKQLPAIMQKGSGMMEDPTVEIMNLTQQMRAPGVIHSVAERNRDEVYFPTESISDDNSRVVVHPTPTALLEQMVQDLMGDERGVEAHPHYRFITHTNRRMYEVGGFIRDMVLAGMGVDVKSTPITQGEYLLNYETSPAAYNGEVVRVLGVKPDPSASHSTRWASYKVEVEGSRGACWVNMVDPRSLPAFEAYTQELQDLLKEANKRKAFDAAKSYLDEICHLSNYWTKMFYTFAMTCHKSQGQTIEHTYVDTTSFAKASNKRALLYVGLSRASKSLHTVKVEPHPRVVAKEINAIYRETKKAYEELFNEPHWKVRARTGLPASTAQQKATLTEYMQALIADREQEIQDAIELQDAQDDA